MSPVKLPHPPHALEAEFLLQRLGGSRHGLSRAEAEARLAEIGPNRLPRPRPPGVTRLFLRQFANPLIYVLLAAAVLSLAIGHHSDALFIGAVLAINALIGTFQEYSAQRAAQALDALVRVRSRVVREGEAWEVDAETLVPGDLVLLESGDRVPADLRLLSAQDLEVDESLLTGESLAVAKAAEGVLSPDTPLAERHNMAFAGTLVVRGRGEGVVVATGRDTELGRIAAGVVEEPLGQAPLVTRMETFTRRVAALVAVAAAVMAAVALARGMALSAVFLMAVALAVSVIPEGLPVALTVALAIGMRRMARRNVIVRRLVAVEALGSCTFIATDKTGTLTLNELTVRRIRFPGLPAWEVSGRGRVPEGAVHTPSGEPEPGERVLLERLARAAVLANEGFLGLRDGQWVSHGDPVDVALLVMAHKAGVTRQEALNTHPQLAEIPFESERLFSASFNEVAGRPHAFVKGAVERLLPMCARMASLEGDRPLDRKAVEEAAAEMARAGFRVLALAEGPVTPEAGGLLGPQQLRDLVFLGLVGMIDPLRPEAKGAVAACRRAGIEVAMVTGDHPVTALAIGRELGLARDEQALVTGRELKDLAGTEAFDRRVRRARIFARVEPAQKLEIVRALQRLGHFVAVSGDGANDAPALRAAQVGVAMGRSGTEVARQSADLVIADDNFASIVAGVEEGRIAYANVRKVIFLLISTGAAELVLFVLALFSGHPLPLVAVQLLWLNLVTNGIQDVALAFEPAEGDELSRPPRPPDEPVFDRLMVERVVLSALVIGGTAFLLYQGLLAAGWTLEAARNATLLLMVLFENVHAFNSRSETRSLFRQGLGGNRLLLGGVILAQGVHVAAMYTPGLREVLGVAPVTLAQWSTLLALALVLLGVMEAHKAWWRRRRSKRGAHADPA